MSFIISDEEAKTLHARINSKSMKDAVLGLQPECSKAEEVFKSVLKQLPSETRIDLLERLSYMGTALHMAQASNAPLSIMQAGYAGFLRAAFGMGYAQAQADAQQGGEDAHA